MPSTFSRSALQALAAAGVAVMSSQALAFSPDHHREFSLDAVKVYLYCAGQLKVPTPAPMASLMKLADGAKLEDSSQLLSRISNWHYSKNPHMPKKWLGFATPHIDTIFPQRIAEMAAAGTTPSPGGGLCHADSLYRAAGRVAHYIQDMRVPAHVIPIHHGFVFGDDAVDSFTSSSRIATWPSCDEFKPYVDAMPTAFQLKTLLDDAVRDTSKAIHDPVDFDDTKETQQACTWEYLYWCDPLNPKSKCKGALSGFGQYRSERIPADLDAAQQKICGRAATATTPAFRKFFRKRYEGAVRDTAAILFMTAYLARTNSCE